MSQPGIQNVGRIYVMTFLFDAKPEDYPLEAMKDKDYSHQGFHYIVYVSC